jgi:DNA-binding NarL/FixJ family response regulator
VIRVVVVDDEALVRSGLRMILEAAGDIAVVAEARDGNAAIAAVARHRPHVVLMDVRMPGMDGPCRGRTDRCGRERSEGHHADHIRPRRVRACGAARRCGGVPAKDTPPRDLAAAVRTVAGGDAMLAPSVTRRLIAEFAGRQPARRRAARQRLAAALTDREQQVARAVAQGMSNAEIGRELAMSEATVKAHVSRALAKLRLANRVQAAILVHDAGLDASSDA